MTLALAGVLCLAAAAELLTAVIADRRIAVWDRVPLPASHATRIVVLLAAMLLLNVVLWLAVRGRPAALRIDVDGGTVIVPSGGVSAIVAHVLGDDPDVLSSRTSVRSSGGELVLDVDVNLRPLAEGEAVGGRLRDEMSVGLKYALGEAATVGRVRTRVVAVGELARYL